jgi:response regulator RpfG family c-di-GMP phosphodiesterase
MKPSSLPRILCVDDESHVLDGLGRILRREFDVTTAVGGEAGLAAIEQEGRFAVVMSDQRMPGMDGVTFLSRVRVCEPDAVRILLTGYADTTSAIGAVNEGAVFRFLTKPIAQQELQQTLAAAVEQHRLITSERVLLQETLHGSIKAVTDILAMVNPAGFGRALRAKEIVGEIAEKLELSDGWRIEIAAMLSQVGTVTLSTETVHKIYHGLKLTLSETLAMARLPKIAAELVSNIPRMEEVGVLLSNMDLRFDGANGAGRDIRGQEIPLGARMLKIALDFDVLESQGMPAGIALDALRGRVGWYDPDLLDTLAEVRGAGPSQKVLEIELSKVESGMTLADDVRTETGMLLIARGQQVTPRMVDRILGTLRAKGLRQLVRVTFPQPEEVKKPPAASEDPETSSLPPSESSEAAGGPGGESEMPGVSMSKNETVGDSGDASAPSRDDTAPASARASGEGHGLHEGSARARPAY